MRGSITLVLDIPNLARASDGSMAEPSRTTRNRALRLMATSERGLIILRRACLAQGGQYALDVRGQRALEAETPPVLGMVEGQEGRVERRPPELSEGGARRHASARGRARAAVASVAGDRMADRGE